jgi:deoxycytidine triphosphate deaminase
MSNDRVYVSDRDAEERFSRNKRRDPYPKLEPALLNSNDINKYAKEVGMVAPYDSDHLKSASYKIHIGERIVYWDKNGERKENRLTAGETFMVAANSIVFIETREKFRLPHYIAMRFNLKIDNVHKGILLGTGPLVDPGFVGNLLIPLHNLTTNNYYFHCGQDFVWAEFTKTSPLDKWKGHSVPADTSDKEFYDGTSYKAFPDQKKDMRPEHYLGQAHAGPIRSSLPDVVEQARREARNATYLSYAIGTAVIAVIISVILFVSTYVDGVVELKVREIVKEELDRN